MVYLLGVLWLHSIAVSTTAEALAKHRKLAETNDVFTPALLHDMGKADFRKISKRRVTKISKALLQKEYPWM